MKLSGVFALFALIVMVIGAWWAAAIKPVILSLGAIFGAIDLDVLNVETIQWINLMPYKSLGDRRIIEKAKEDKIKEEVEKLTIDSMPEHIQKTIDDTIKDTLHKDGVCATEEEIK